MGEHTKGRPILCLPNAGAPTDAGRAIAAQRHVQLCLIMARRAAARLGRHGAPNNPRSRDSRNTCPPNPAGR